MAEGELKEFDLEQVVKGWSEVTIDKLAEAIDDFEIGELHGGLWRSLVYELAKANGDVERVLLKFRQYGRFIDMRVGRGLKFAQKGQPTKMGNYGRKKAPWYSKTKTREIGVLRYILVTKFSKHALAEIENAFTQTETFNP